MNRERWDKKMQETSETQQQQMCSRAEDLVAYLYGEASPEVASDFEAHAGLCDSCRTELAAFQQVRGSVREWRRLSLGATVANALEASAFNETASRAPSRQRSALAALREFFALSPLWMRAATAVLTVSACALVILSIARAEVRWDDGGLSFRTGAAHERLVERTRTVEVEKPVKVGYSQEELEQMVAERVRQERQSWQKQQQPVKIINTGAPSRSTVAARNAPQSTNDAAARNASRQTVAQRDRSDEEDLPCLYDLLDESN
jgi:hypothetical protein